MKVKKFHQFVKVEKGPVNAAVIDLLRGNVFQVENHLIAALEQCRYEEIPEFIAAVEAEGLIIDIDNKRWLPTPVENQEERYEGIDDEINIELHVEEGIDLESLLKKLHYYTIYRVVFYGEKMPQINSKQLKIVRKEKNPEHCIQRMHINGEFERISEPVYLFNKKYNSCWGEKLAISQDGKVRPCIYSNIIVGDIREDDIEGILEKLKELWKITKDSVEKCKDCELRHVCFDCREMARRNGGKLFSAPHMCNYDPYKGTWNK